MRVSARDRTRSSRHSGLYKPGDTSKIGESMAPTHLESVWQLAERWLGFAGVKDSSELAELDAFEASLLKPVRWQRGTVPLGVRVAQRITESLAGDGSDKIRVALEQERRFAAQTLGELGPTRSQQDLTDDGKHDPADEADETPALTPQHYKVLRVMKTHPLDSWPVTKVASSRNDSTNRESTGLLLRDLLHPNIGLVRKTGKGKKAPYALTEAGRSRKIADEQLPAGI